MSTALAELPTTSAPTVTTDQIELIKRTVANGATADELKLYLYDCARQGVHPLDRLIHFTKRKDKFGNSKYTPITSIDFMRTRAADTNEYAGSDDASYSGVAQHDDFAASVTVYRMVQGQRCPFTATARWAEYKPGDDFMWRKMPHTMLAKCAEALALRKGFPRQLAGLYAKEEMDQAGEPRGYVVEPLTTGGTASSTATPATTQAPATVAALGAPARSVPDSGPSLPAGAVLITKVEAGWGQKVKGFIRHSGQIAGSDGIALYRDDLVTLASEVCQLRQPVTLELKTPASGKSYVQAIHRVDEFDKLDAELSEPLDDSSIPF